MQIEDDVEFIIKSILIGQTVSTAPTLLLLNKILIYFVNNTTFTTIDFHNQIAIPATSKDAFFRTFDTPKKGGSCFQINGALHYLLSAIGYTAQLHPARVKAEGSMRFDFLQDSHMALTVKFEDKMYLVDPGWGNIPEKILCINGEEAQKRSGKFQVTVIDHKVAYQLFINSEQQWVTQFEFEPNNCLDYQEFETLNKFVQSADYAFRENMFTVKSTREGLYVLENSSLELFRRDGKKEAIDITPLGGIKPVLQDIFKLSEEYLAEFDIDKLPQKLADKLKPNWVTEHHDIRMRLM